MMKRSPEPSAEEAQNLQPAPFSTEGTASTLGGKGKPEGATPTPKAGGDQPPASFPGLRKESLRRAYHRCMRSTDATRAWRAFEDFNPTDEEHLECIQGFEASS